MTLTLKALPGIPLIKPGDSISRVILDAIGNSGIALQDEDILVLAQKIVSKSENRFINLSQVQPSQRAIELARQTEKDARMVELILQESNSVLRTRIGTIIVEHRQGFVCANAGIDHSNVQGLWGNPDDWVLLLPEDSDKSAERIRRELENATGARLGVMIIDTHGRAWRMGTVGVAIGLSGMPAVVDLRGTEDMFGYRLRVTQVASADELAAAASLLMGQAAEGTPVIHVRGFPFPLREGSLHELIRPKELDLFS